MAQKICYLKLTSSKYKIFSLEYKSRLKSYPTINVFPIFSINNHVLLGVFHVNQFPSLRMIIYHLKFQTKCPI